MWELIEPMLRGNSCVSYKTKGFTQSKDTLLYWPKKHVFAGPVPGFMCVSTGLATAVEISDLYGWMARSIHHNLVAANHDLTGPA